MLKRIWLSTTSLANQISTGTDTLPSTVEPKPSLIQSRRGRLILLCAIVFVLASAVRLLYFEDRFTEIERGTSFLTTLVKPYRQDALQMLEDRSFFSPKHRPDGGETRLLLHPPGYALVILLIYGAAEPDDSYGRLRFLQITFDAFAVVMVLLIAAELLPLWVAALGAMVVALSPHLAIYSLYLSPESLAVLPILVAVYLILRAKKRPRVGLIALAGVMIGLSCWFRSNGLFLTVFVAAAVLMLFERGKCLRYATLLIVATVVIISPITIRNWILSGRFVPLSLGAGITLMEGIGDYDKEGRFDMPATDAAVARREVEWFNEPAYERSLWEPDGIEREQARLARALKVVGSNPGWFLGVMIRRAGFMVRYNQDDPGGWPFDTSQAAYVSGEPPFKHRTTETDNLQIVERFKNRELFADAIKSPGTQIVFEPDNQTLHLAGDGTAYGDQIISRPLSVDKDSDFILEVAFNLTQGDAAIKILSGDMRYTFNSVGLASAADEQRLLEKYKRKALAKSNASAVEAPVVDTSTSLEFASGPRDQVRIAVSNNGSPAPALDLKQLTLQKAGSTPGLWTRYLRLLIRGLQRNLFLSSRMLPLIGLGILLLAVARRWSALVVLLVVPSYYLVVQSALHTEYRYILAIHYFLLTITGVALACIFLVVGRGMRLAFAQVRGHKPRL
jgi:dolichyl-phosphate-mannose-protein mannosyltransferase